MQQYKSSETYREIKTQKAKRKGDIVTWVAFRTSPNAPSASFFLFSSEIDSNSAISWWFCKIPLPLLSILQHKKHSSVVTKTQYLNGNKAIIYSNLLIKNTLTKGPRFHSCGQKESRPNAHGDCERGSKHVRPLILRQTKTSTAKQRTKQT